ncbi:hypothetical protein GSY74_07815 [Sulfurovum sp. bin170]|uniref:hypothetical protein n=1 Tax=Sulfurovum sp. bin170 TaxID=2695268 RepID=UPI0013DF828D|nr:hypothetical protein [Sulfurovum sp. bin170]NEW61186.1 hypothetical protein [Sulfurovum sp. bin170]
MRRLITNMAMMTVLLLFAVGCGEGSSTNSTPTEDGATGMTVNVSVDKGKSQGSLYQKTDMQIHHVGLEVDGGGLTAVYPDDMNSLDGWQFDIFGLPTGTSLTFEARAYNLSNEVLAKATTILTIAPGEHPVIEMGLVQEVTGADVEDEPIHIIGKTITENAGDASLSDIVFTLSNPEEIHYDYEVINESGESEFGGDTYNQPTTFTSLMITGIADGTYMLQIISNNYEYYSYVLIVQDGDIANIYEAPAIGYPDMVVNDTTLTMFFYTAGADTFAYEITSGAGTITSHVVDTTTANPSIWTHNYAVTIEGYDASSDFKIKFTATNTLIPDITAYPTSHRIFPIHGNPQ